MSDRISVITIETVRWQADWTPNVEEFNGVTEPTEGYDSTELCSVETKSRLTFKLGPTVWPVGHLNLGLIQQTFDFILQSCYSGGPLCQTLRAAQYRGRGSGCSPEGLREVEVVQDLAAIRNN